MTLINAVGVFQILHCDGQDPDGRHCTRVFDGEATEPVEAVRSRAREHSWGCVTSWLSRRPPRDLCPEHHPTQHQEKNR